MKREELSILIPEYNHVCVPLVANLRQQASVTGIHFEIIVADDGSSDKEYVRANEAINDMEHCRFIRRERNAGRSAIRNFLARESRYGWLLFLDCDMEVPNQSFIERYLQADDAQVIDGGIAVGGDHRQWSGNLRYKYERYCEGHHTAEARKQHPYRSFRSTNFMVSRQVMMEKPFDERFLHYGYEDVLFGKRLQQGGIPILHIDNPLLLTDYETNAVFVAKTEESIRTLHLFREELRGYSALLTFAEGIHLGLVRQSFKLWHTLFGAAERWWLCHCRPSLLLFRLYKAGYLLKMKD